MLAGMKSREIRRDLVNLVIYDSGQVFLELLLLPWYPADVGCVLRLTL